MERLRFVTAASLFDGHDVSINIMRRMLQSKGVEVIHLGHNRSALDVVQAVIQEDAHAVALSSYQGGHNEYFSYIRTLLNEEGREHVRIFGGGGGVITPKEAAALESKGITKIYGPGDGMRLGLDGIIEDMIQRARFNSIDYFENPRAETELTQSQLAQGISFIENTGELPFKSTLKDTKVFGVTGTGGAGKSSLIDEILLRFGRYYPESKVALISVDPTKKKNQGALLGDRIRLGCCENKNIFIRSLATRNSKTELSPQIEKVVQFLKGQSFDLILIETSGIGQASDAITTVSDKCLYVMTPEFGAQSQLEKIEMLEQADFVAINKFEKPRSEDALRDVRKQYRRNHELFEGHSGSPTDEELPIYGTIASQFNDTGVNALFFDIAKEFDFDLKTISSMIKEKVPTIKSTIIPAERANYLREISSVCEKYDLETKHNLEILKEYEALLISEKILSNNKELIILKREREKKMSSSVLEDLNALNEKIKKYDEGEFSFKVREKELTQKTKFESLSGLKISRIGLPRYESLVDQYKFIRNQNLPGAFPYTSGIFPFKRTNEDPKRMFAGEGGPERTNKRFHYLSKDDPAKRLSTAFDSVTLYGEDPDERPDIFGKVGEAGVSIATLDDMKTLFKGFDLIDPMTSVSMTINGPAPIILAMYFNTALHKALSEEELKDESKRNKVLRKIRGTVQADILKEDQAQNTCIFSLDFSLKMMGDVQEFFCEKEIKNFYSVSVSGYHIAEAGANPITQLAFTLSNGFTLVENYLSRGMKIDEISQNISFFFSNGLDAEYTVIGRVARKIWAVAMRDKYKASEKSQKFKYHIQTSGRSLHAQEIDFNDIRTTLQAFLALSDNCNSLHTNAYDEAITTPTQESVRRAMAIQMIINKEFGLSKTDNPLQGSFIADELAELVEKAVLAEFKKISDKGGVLGAMESMYQRSKIQEESLYYERLKDSGSLPIIGVNTYISDDVADQLNKEIDLTRASDAEKEEQIFRLRSFLKRGEAHGEDALNRLEKVALEGNNIFAELINTVNYCSLGQITNRLYTVGGKYRRNM